MAEGSKISLSLGSKKPVQPHRSNGTKRPHAALHDSDDEDDHSQHQEITHFDTIAGGAVNAANKVVERAPLVIPVGENRRKKQKSNLPSQNTEAAVAAAAESKAKAAPVLFGLNVNRGTGKAQSVGEDSPSHSQEPSSTVISTRKTVDEEALDALLGNKVTSNTVISAISEEEIFLRDYEKAPDAPTEADYDAVPIEEFGAAMLRGMGWKDGEAIGRSKGQAPVKPRVIERRAELLGVGAKPAKAVGIELGEWGKHAKKHERAINKVYAPVMLRNKKTGEMVTEEEFKALTKDEEMGLVGEEDDAAERSSAKPRTIDRSGEQRRDKERRRDYDRDNEEREYKSSRRDRIESSDAHRRHRDDDESERREHRGDRDRKHRDRSIDDRDRHSSSRSNKHRAQDRDQKYRDHDRSYRKEKSSRKDRDSGRRER